MKYREIQTTKKTQAANQINQSEQNYWISVGMFRLLEC